MNIPIYEPGNWFWEIAETGEIWSSARACVVGVDDPGYIAWASRPGSMPTMIATRADLVDVLERQFPDGVGAGLRVPMADDVAHERAKRLASGFDYDFGDARGVHRIGTTPEDLAGWDEVSKFAGALIDTGMPAGTIDIFTDTGPVSVTAAEWRAIEVAAAAFRQPIWVASFALAAMDPIPADLENDSHWP